MAACIGTRRLREMPTLKFLRSLRKLSKEPWLAILAIAIRLASGWQAELAGVYHAAGAGATTWHGLATATFEVACRHGLASPIVDPITTDQWPTKAARPADSRLDCGKLEAVFGLRLPPWRDGLTRTVDAIFASQATGG